MRGRLGEFLLLLGLGSCQSAPGAPDTVDAATLRTITRPQAISYLRQVAAAHMDFADPKGARATGSVACAYSDAGIATPGTGGVYLPYDQWRYTVLYGGNSIEYKYAMVQLTPVSCTAGRTTTSWVLLREVSGLTADIKEQFADVTTALTVLGVTKSDRRLIDLH